MKKRVVSMFLALVVVLSFLLSISSFAYTASFSGYTNDFSIFNNHPTYGTLKLRIRQSAAFDGMYFEAKGEY